MGLRAGRPFSSVSGLKLLQPKKKPVISVHRVSLVLPTTRSGPSSAVAGFSSCGEDIFSPGGMDRDEDEFMKVQQSIRPAEYSFDSSRRKAVVAASMKMNDLHPLLDTGRNQQQQHCGQYYLMQIPPRESPMSSSSIISASERDVTD